MKRKLLALISMVLVLSVAMISLAACGEKAQDTADTQSADTQSTVSKPEKKATLTMATNAEFPPYEYKEGDKIVGIDAEIAALIADKLGMELEIKDVDFDSIIPGVQQGKYDMGMAGMTVTDERLQTVNFSSSYATGVQVVIVPENSTITSIDDLEGKTIGVQQGTTGDIYAQDDYGSENLVAYPNGAIAVQSLKSGKVDCVIIDNEPAKAYVAANEGLKILETEYVAEDYAICFAKNNTDLQQKVDNALKELIQDGSVKKVVDKYIKAD